MDDYTKRLVLCFSEKLDQAKVGYIEWNSFKLMAMVRTGLSSISVIHVCLLLLRADMIAESNSNSPFAGSL